MVLTIESSLKSLKTVNKRLCLALEALGVYLRDTLPRRMVYQQQLTTFTRVPLTELISQATQDLSVDDLPGKRGDLTIFKRGHYREMYEFCNGDAEMLDRLL